MYAPVIFYVLGSSVCFGWLLAKLVDNMRTR